MNHEAIVTSLMKMVLPKILTNKIINACLREHTSIQWFGKKIEHQRKTRGIKHGCSLSPRLFAIALEHAIEVTRGALRNFNTDSQLQPPTLLAYADDLIVIADKIEDIGDFVHTSEVFL